MPIIQPSRSDVHVDGPLTNYSRAYMQDAGGFVADRAFPQLPVNKKSDSFFRYLRSFWNRSEMRERAPGTESAGANYGIDTDTYSARRFALHRDVDDETRENADAPIALDQEAVRYLTLQLLLKKEIDWAGSFFITGVWANEDAGVSGAPGAGQFQQWNEAASSPVEVVRASITSVHEGTGKRPNRMVLGRQVYDKLLDHPDVLDRLNRGQTSGPAMANRQTLAALFELEEVLVMDAIQNTAVEGATEASSFIGGKNALLLYSEAPGLMSAQAGITYSWSRFGGIGGLIRRIRMEELTSDRIEIEGYYDQKLVASDLGYMLLDAVA